MSETPAFGVFQDEVERVMRSFDEILGTSTLNAVMSDSFAQIAKMSEEISATFLGSNSYRSAIAHLEDSLRDFQFPDLSQNLELPDEASAGATFEPTSVSVGVDLLADDPSETTGLDLQLILTFMLLLLQIAQILVALRADPQLVEIAELLRERNELLVRIVEATGGS